MTMLLRRLSLLLTLLLWVAPAGAAEYLPKPFEARYSVHFSGLKVGELDRSLRIESDGTYVLETVTYTTGLVALFKKDRVVERSTWRYRDGQPIPIAYYAHYTGRAKDVVERMDFDWERNVALSLRDNKTTEVPLQPGTLDKQMYQAVLCSDIDAGKNHMEYIVADRGEIRPYIFDVVGKDEVVTARGTVNAVKVKKGTTTFWVAPEWDYLLVKLVQENEDGTIATYLKAK